MDPKKRRYKPAPPPPADPENYVRVETREGVVFRKKRKKRPPLNDSLEGNSKRTVLASPAAARIRGVLEPYLRGLDTGRFIANISSRLRKAMKQKGRMDFTFMDNYDFQPYRPIWEVIKGQYSNTWKEKDKLFARLHTGPDAVAKKTKDVSDYFFELILVYGDPSADGRLYVEHSVSPLYTFDSVDEGTVTLSVPLPEDGISWMAIIKVSCLQGNEMANHARHYGMRVVEVG